MTVRQLHKKQARRQPITIKNLVNDTVKGNNSKLFYYLTVTSFYLLKEKKEHAKYPWVLHSRSLYYTLVSWFEDTDTIIKGLLVEL